MKKNKNIIVTIGLPGSGKTTWGKSFLKQNSDYVKIERDDLRFGLRDISIGDKNFETLITKLQYQMVHTALNNKYNVILSDTNCNKKYLEAFINEFKYKANITFKIFDTPVETCIDRDSKRERKVGEEVIKRMNNGFKDVINNMDLNPITKLPEIHQPHFYDDTLLDCIIIDLDGTIAHANNKRGIYDFKEVGVDDLDYNMFKIIESIASNDVALIFLTARSEICYDETLAWLTKNNFPLLNYMLLMRNEGDFRPSTVVKQELYKTYVKGKLNVLCAFDDKTDVIEMWRDNDIKALQVISDK
jgi:hypothetical protein